MGRLAGLVLGVLAINAITDAAFGYPVAYCAGAFIGPFMAPFFGIAAFLATFALVGAIILQRWALAGGMMIGVVAAKAIESSLAGGLFGHLCS